MLHFDDLAARHRRRYLADVFGPRGIALASDIADGMIVGRPVARVLPTAVLMPATALEPGEDRDSARVRGLCDRRSGLPGGRECRTALEFIDKARRRPHFELRSDRAYSAGHEATTHVAHEHIDVGGADVASGDGDAGLRLGPEAQ